MELTPATFATEIEEAVRSFDKFIVCLGKSTDECQASLESLIVKAIRAFETRKPGLRHGIALDKQVTIILSQNDQSDRPLCGIYFNLSSPYHRQPQPAKSES